MSFKVRLTLWFLVISLIPMMLVIYFSYTMTSRALRAQVLNQLESIANVQKNRMDSVLGSRRSEFLAFLHHPHLRELLVRFLRTPDPSNRDNLSTILSTLLLDHPDYKQISFFDLNGKLIASTALSRQARHGKRGNQKPLRAKTGDQVRPVVPQEQHVDARRFWFQRAQQEYSVALVPGAEKGTLNLRLSAPLVVEEAGQSPNNSYPRTINRRLVGVCVVESTTRTMMSLLADRTGLGESGLSFLARRSRQDPRRYVFVTPIERPGETVPVLRISTGRPPRNISSIEDFQGVPVLSALRPLEIPGWKLGVKVDRDEALLPVHDFRDLVTWVLGGLSLLTIFASFSLARQVTEPLEILTHAAKLVSEGDLSARVPVRSVDELGVLGRAFNQMASSLENVQTGLESKVAYRTSELKAANQRLQELDRMKSEFLATMSHELRTPLSSIMGFSEILMTDDHASFDTEQVEHLRCVHNSARHLLNLIEEILVVSKTEAGQMKLDPQ